MTKEKVRRPQQQELKGVVPPLNKAQKAALTYAEGLEELAILKDRINKRRDEMLTICNEAGVDEVKVRDKTDYTHTFTIASKTNIKHKKALELAPLNVKIN